VSKPGLNKIKKEKKKKKARLLILHHLLPFSLALLEVSRHGDEPARDPDPRGGRDIGAVGKVKPHVHVARGAVDGELFAGEHPLEQFREHLGWLLEY
jgi:hypothetical protein